MPPPGNELTYYSPYENYAGVTFELIRNQSGTGVPLITAFMYFVPNPIQTFVPGGIFYILVNNGTGPLNPNCAVAYSDSFNNIYGDTYFGIATANSVDINGKPIIGPIIYVDAEGNQFRFPGQDESTIFYKINV